MNTEIILINLEHSTERLSYFKELGLDFTILPAFNGLSANIYKDVSNSHVTTYNPSVSHDKLVPGEIGNLMSHIIAITYAKMKNLSEVIILEDDIEICDDFIERYEICMKQIPKNWTHIYLGALTDKLGMKMNENVYKSMPSLGTHAYVIRKAAYDKMIRELTLMKAPTDHIMYDMIRLNKLNSYSFIPFLTCQNSTYSTVQQNETKSAKNFYQKKL